MNDLGRWVMLLGGALVVIGAVVWLAGKSGLPLGRLPGDIRIARGNFRFYFPLATSLIVSVVLTLIFWLLRRF